MTIRTKLYLFYITFFAILAIFPVTTDYITQTYLLLDVPLFAPFPSETFKIILMLGGTFVLSYFILSFSIRKNKTDKLEYISITIFRYSLAFVMIFIYGYAKIAYKQFELDYGAMDTLLRNVSEKDLTWYFFGKSNVQTLLYGLMEFIPCILLLFRKTTFLGAVLLLPALLGVVLTNIFNDIEYHTLLFGIMFLFFDIGILLFYRKEIALVFTTAKHKLQFTFVGKKTKVLFLIVKIIFIGLFVIRYCNSFYLSTQMSTAEMSAPSKCFGAFQLQNITYDDKNYDLDSLPNYWKKLYFEKFGKNNMLRDKWENNVNMFYVFSDNKDSIQIVTCKVFDKDENPIDTTSIFKGTYMLSSNDSVLTLRGIKNDTLIKADYKKLPIDGHDWWW
jgi:hypothetical protein